MLEFPKKVIDKGRQKCMYSDHDFFYFWKRGVSRDAEFIARMADFERRLKVRSSYQYNDT